MKGDDKYNPEQYYSARYWDRTGNKEEFQELVALAEAVSSNVSSIKERISKIRGILIYSFALPLVLMTISAYISVQSEITGFLVIPLGIITIALFVAFSYLYVMGSRKLSQLRKDLELELMILKDLMVMVDEYKQFMHQSMSRVEAAVIDIRLKRISYSSE